MNRDINRTLSCCGFLLLLLSCVGLWHSAGAGLSYVVYHHVKFTPPMECDKPEPAAMRCEIAYRFYPYNYYLCIWIAEKCWYGRYDVDGRESPGRLDLARRWCDRGLTLNRRKSQLRLLKTRLLARGSVSDAIAEWKDYVDWHFWDPYNHAVLVELYAEAGDYAPASKSLAWVKGSQHYAEAELKLRQSWANEMSRPPGVDSGATGR